MLVASATPGGYIHGAGNRGVKNPDAPPTIAKPAFNWLSHCRAASLLGKSVFDWSLQHHHGLVVTPSQNTRSLSTRTSGALPAISAPLMAPIEMPATQSG